METASDSKPSRSAFAITSLILLSSISTNLALAYDICGASCLHALKHCSDEACREQVYAALGKCRRTGQLDALRA